MKRMSMWNWKSETMEPTGKKETIHEMCNYAMQMSTTTSNSDAVLQRPNWAGTPFPLIPLWLLSSYFLISIDFGT